MQLYTPMVRLKQQMNSGTLPPMTPVPEKVHSVIDPDFTIGLGALDEDPEKGLRCPVRGCGVYRHRLTVHLNSVHEDLGGAEAIKRLLSIPRTATLISASQRDQRSAISKAQFARLAPRLAAANGSVRSASAQSKRSRTRSASMSTVGARNLAEQCRAQLSHKLIDLEHSLGRSPSSGEAADRLGSGFVHAVVQVFGSWSSAKAACGMEARLANRWGHRRTQSIRRTEVLEGMSAWYDAHKALPTITEARRPNRAPLIPSPATVFRAMGTTSWRVAMRRVAALLDIRGGRYGLPEKPQSEAAD